MALLRPPQIVLERNNAEEIAIWREVLRRLEGEGAAASVPKSLFDENSLLIANTDNTPEALTVAASRILGRAGSGGIAALTAAQGRTVLALGALATGDTGSDVPVSGFSNILSGQTDVQGALDVIDLLVSSGLSQEAADSADGTSESMQVTATSTPSTINRMVCLFKGIVPEIDGDALGSTVILADDSELTSASYDHVGYRNIAGTGADVSAVGATNMNHGGIGNASGEYFNGSIVMESQNGTDTVKAVVYNAAYTDATGSRLHFRRSFFISTSQAIKGFRIDTDNAGDMIDAGDMELWVQV